MKRLMMVLSTAVVLFAAPTFALANPQLQLSGGAHWDKVGVPDKNGNPTYALVLPTGSSVFIGNIQGINSSALSYLAWEGKNGGDWTSTSPRWEVYLRDQRGVKYTAQLPHWASKYSSGSSIDFTLMEFSNIPNSLSGALGISTQAVAKLAIDGVSIKYDGSSYVVLYRPTITVNGQKWPFIGP